MHERTVPAMPDDLSEAYSAATELARDQRLLDVLAESRRDLDLRREATRDPLAFLEARGIELPRGLAIRFGQNPRPFMPSPDWEFFLHPAVRLPDLLGLGDRPDHGRTQAFLGRDLLGLRDRPASRPRRPCRWTDP